MNNFMEGLKNQISTFCISADGLWIFFAALLWRKWKIKSWLASLKTVTNFKNTSRDPLQRACCGIQKPACYCRTRSIIPMWFWKLFRKPPMTCIFRPTFPLSNERWSRGGNQPMTQIVSRGRILWRLSVQASVFVSVFIEASKIILINIFFNRLPKMFRNHWWM